MARELRIPQATLLHFREAFSAEADEETTSRVMRRAGVLAADSVLDQFSAGTHTDPATLGMDRFWQELGRFFFKDGWGELSHERIHPALGLVRSAQWGESDPRLEAKAPTCAFSEGMLSGVFSRIAGSAIGVLEVSCRSRGDVDCAFALGSQDAVRRLEELLHEGGNLETALHRLA